MPSANPKILGVAEIRHESLPIIDLAKAIGSSFRTLSQEDIDQGSVITTEVNRSHQGFWVSGIDKIVLCDWEDIKPPASGTGIGSYTTGIIEIEGELVQLLDIEKVLGEVLGLDIDHKTDLHISQQQLEVVYGKLVMIVDDSQLAMNQTITALERMGLQHISAKDGKRALNILHDYQHGEPHTVEPIDMIISDIEMPEMDGYTFVKKLRELEMYQHIHVLMHTSLNGSVNLEKAIAAGANDVLTKFVPEELARKIVDHLLAKEL